MGRVRSESVARMVDVAKAAGCSRAAVTHVLTGSGQGQIRVSDEKARLIRAVAKQLNFHPSHAAQLLKGKPSTTLGLISANWREPLHLRAFYWLQVLAAQRGYQLLTAQCLTLEETERTVVQFRSRGIDGAMVFAEGQEFRTPAMRACLSQLPLLVSLVGRPLIPASVALEFDEADGIDQTVRHLQEQGRRKIALLLEDRSASSSRRRQGFLQAHKSLGIDVKGEQIFVGTKLWIWSLADLREQVDAAIERLVFGCGVDALIASNDHVGAFLAQGLSRRGLRVPADVALVGCENDLVSHHTNPPLTTIAFPVRDLAQAAVDMLTADGKGADAASTGAKPETRFRSQTFKPVLMVRGTS